MVSKRLQAVAAKVAAKNRPMTAMIEVTHRCHLACAHCYLEDNHSWDSREHELSTEELCSAVEQLHAEGCLFLTITGGEVFLRRDVFAVIGRARELGMAVIVFTTGTLLSDRIVEKIAALHLWRVELSLYSTDPAVHDDITRRTGSHARTMAALHRLRAAGIHVLIKCPLMRQNFDSYAALRALAEELGIAFVADVTLTPKNDADPDPTRYRLTTEQLTWFYTQPEIQPSASPSPRLPSPGDRICSIGERSCQIGPFGDVYACGGFKTPIGNLRQQSFAQIWRESPLLRKVRGVTARDLGVCASCHKFSYCNRCAGMALSEHGDFFGPSAWACHLAAAKERAAGIEVTPSAAERLGLVEIVDGALVVHESAPSACASCGSGCGIKV